VCKDNINGFPESSEYGAYPNNDGISGKNALVGDDCIVN